MKTQQEIQHQSPLRKSPRFSAPHPSLHNLARPKPAPETRPDDAWALSLHVAEQVPLKTCYPSDEEDKPIRRSSRFTANKYKTPSPKISKTKPPHSSPSILALTLRGHEDARSGEKRRRFSEDREATGRATKKTKLGSDELMLLRRSYRLKGGKIGSSAPQLLALPGPGSKSTEKCFLSEKRLRSRSVLMHKVEKVSTKVNSSIKYLLPPLVNHALVKLPEVTVKEPVKSASTEMSYRSRTVKLSDGNVKRKDLIELPENLRRNSLRRSHKDVVESSKQASPEKSAFSSEKRLKSRNVKMQSQKETLETLPEKSRSSLRRSRKRSGESSKIESKKSTYSRSVKMHLQKEISETLPEKSSSLKRSSKNSGESSNFELKKSAFSGETCLSSRSVEMELEKESSEKSGYVLNEKRLLSPKIESVLDELFGVYEETDVEKSDSDVASEECERSRTIEHEINVDENSERTMGRVEGRWGSESEGDDVEENVRSETKEKNVVCSFVEEPIREEVAHEKWKWRYELKSEKKGKSWKRK